MTQRINIISLYADGNYWVVETEPGTYLYLEKTPVAPVEQGVGVMNTMTDNGLCDDGVTYFLTSYVERMQQDSVGKTIVIDNSVDTMVTVEST